PTSVSEGEWSELATYLEQTADVPDVLEHLLGLVGLRVRVTVVAGGRTIAQIFGRLDAAVGVSASEVVSSAAPDLLPGRVLIGEDAFGILRMPLKEFGGARIGAGGLVAVACDEPGVSIIVQPDPSADFDDDPMADLGVDADDEEDLGDLAA